MQEVGQFKKIECKRSSVHGWGVFALEEIHPEEIIEMAPGVIAPMEILRMCYYMMMAEGIDKASLKLDQYGLAWPDDQVMIPFGWIGLYNHNDNPLAEFTKDDNKQLIGVKAIRKISAGEEITVHYGKHWWEQKGYLQKI